MLRPNQWPQRYIDAIAEYAHHPKRPLARKGHAHNWEPYTGNYILQYLVSHCGCKIIRTSTDTMQNFRIALLTCIAIRMTSTNWPTNMKPNVQNLSSPGTDKIRFYTLLTSCNRGMKRRRKKLFQDDVNCWMTNVIPMHIVQILFGESLVISSRWLT